MRRKVARMLERARWTGKKKLAAGNYEAEWQSGVCPENSGTNGELGRAASLSRRREPARAQRVCARQEKGPRRSREGHSHSLSTHDEVMLPVMGDGLNRAALMESVLRLLGCFWRLGRAASDRGMGGAGCARRRGMVRGGFAQRLATWGASTSLHLFPWHFLAKDLEARKKKKKEGPA